MNWLKLAAHAATYVSGAAMVFAGGVAEMGLSMPGIDVSNPKTVVATGAGLIAAAWKADHS